MKLFKKLAGLLLAMVMVFSMSTAAFAAQGTNNDSGSITINDAVKGHTYNAYQILVLESYNTDAGAYGAYAYRANPVWESWLSSQTAYVNIDAQGYVTWVQDADPAAFAKEALAYAGENNIQPTETVTADSTTVQFENLNLGYYLLDTTLGTLCSLDTTIPNVTMQEKNEVPSQEKKVQEDSDESWGTENTAEIGDTVNYRTTIKAKPGAQSYVLHDEMSVGLTLKPESITVTEPDSLTKGEDADNGDYHVVTTGLSDGCTFEVVFHQSYLDTITADMDIVVTYNAVVNENAEVSPSANPNKTTLKYGEDSEFETVPSETKTYTFKVDVVKTDDKNKVLDGAQFKLYDAKTGGNEIALVKVSDGVYRFAKVGETGEEYITTVNGQLEIKGFDANTNYYLEETKAPDGYNKLAEREEIAVKEANLEASVSNDTWQSGGVHIVNKTGSLIPSTGGMGTTIFYIIGGVLVAAAGIFFVIRRRVSAGK
ncbi:MAG TPA: SpaH/EbpB family LPXTG-anchored major pilin [Candidatus Pullilachnospira stercoravium]|uniref:SpaH/EbpB family LPXTG-anchored major pilin n=1 Tax=Candidatus Pullilachnospira stercoravium TaxID=2840913 RepID=A0A9D1T5K3_9FIRM|nr:SpaH/EbpB family LPXTG-anchored major pilin [Candidatus Pullilachnospira stercoravium]